MAVSYTMGPVFVVRLICWIQHVVNCVEGVEMVKEDQKKKMKQCKSCHKQSRTEVVWFGEVTFGLNFIVNFV